MGRGSRSSFQRTQAADRQTYDAADLQENELTYTTTTGAADLWTTPTQDPTTGAAAVTLRTETLVNNRDGRQSEKAREALRALMVTIVELMLECMASIKSQQYATTKGILARGLHSNKKARPRVARSRSGGSTPSAAGEEAQAKRRPSPASSLCQTPRRQLVTDAEADTKDRAIASRCCIPVVAETLQSDGDRAHPVSKERSLSQQ